MNDSIRVEGYQKMVVETPSDREFACFFCANGKTKDLNADCPDCGKPINVGPLFLRLTVGDYQLAKYAGRGFYGVTYCAENRIRKQFAVKIIPRLLYRQEGKNFEEEISKYSELGSHPNIAQLIDAGDAELTSDSRTLPVYYIVSEWVSGQSLSDYINKKDLTVGDMYGAILDIASGVSRFEAKNLWHNDLNSDNILVQQLSDEELETRRSESRYICKIIDTGSAVFRQPERHHIPDDVKFLGVHISEMQRTLQARASELTKEDRYFLNELGKVVAHILDEDPARSVDRAQTALDEIKILYSRRHTLGEDEDIQLSDPFLYLNANDFPTERYTSLLFSDRFPWLSSIVAPEVQSMLVAGPRGSGKTIILRSMRLRTRLHSQGNSETVDAARKRLSSERLAGFFVSARLEIGNNCPLTKLPRWAASEEQVNLYFNLLLTYEVVESIYLGMTKQLIDVPIQAERRISSYVCGALEDGSVVGFAGLLSLISGTQNRIIRDEYARAVKPGIVGPNYLSQLCAMLKKEIPFFAKKNIVFLLDDFSLPKVPAVIQRALLPIIWNPGGGYSFRVTAHSESMVTEDSRGNTYARNRDYVEINLGASYINNVDLKKNLVQIRGCVDEILRKRFELHPPYEVKTLDEFLGGLGMSEEPIAQRIREFTIQKKRRALRYAGWQTVIKLCSGDISYIIDILRRIVGAAPAKYPVARHIQHNEIRRYARNELYRLQDSSVTSCNLYAVAANFGKFSLFKLTKEDVGKKKKRPAEYLRIEVEIDVLSADAKEALGDLLRSAVFIDGGFSSSAKGTPARRLIFKKLFTPVFPTTYNSRDTWPMSAAHFLEFIASPEKYVRSIMGQHGIPPVEQQLELDNLVWP